MTLYIDLRRDFKKNLYLYHVPGSTCEEYREFYKWLRTKPLHYEYTDFPHDYFVLLVETDRLEMHEKYAKHITIEKGPVDISGFRDLTKPMSIDVETQWMFDTLKECIQEEINKEILNKIKSKL
jgi:hypothetical protein